MNQTTLLPKGYESAYAQFLSICQELSHQPACEHYEIESYVQRHGQELLRQLLQAKLNQDAQRVSEQIESSHRWQVRQLESCYGTLTVRQPALLRSGQSSERPLEKQLNLPKEKYSHFFQSLLCQDVALTSYDEALLRLGEHYAGHLPKRQAQEAILRGAQDFEAFYAQFTEAPKPKGALLIGTLDASGIVMRPDALRSSTRKVAEQGGLNRQGKRSHKRMAQVAGVYTTDPHPRTAQTQS